MMSTKKCGVSVFLYSLMAVIVSACASCSSPSSSMTVTLYKTQEKGRGPSIGTVVFHDTSDGLLITPALHDVSPGVHGFHVHENPSCAQAGQAAGGHWDPGKTNQHLGPYSQAGHLGDLPALTADQQGRVTLPVLAPRVKLRALTGHSIMLHAGGDNYSDQPSALGGGGARYACGLIATDKALEAP